MRQGTEPDPIGATAELSQDYVSEDAPRVFVARADDYADALAGAPLAAADGAPILFVEGDTVSDAVLAEIARIAPDEVVILGGVEAVSEAAEAQIADAGHTTRRLAGANRFATAIEVADELDAATGGPSTLYFVEGEHADDARGWPDAINAATVAGLDGSPILPVNAERLPEEIAAYIAANPDAPRVIVGGTSAVSEDVAASIAGEEGEVSRIAGDTRVTTSVAAYDQAVSEHGAVPTTRFVIPGCSYVEGLAASAIAGANSWTTVMVDCENLAASADAFEILGSTLDLVEDTVVVGNRFTDEVLMGIDGASTFEAPEAAFCLRLLHHNDGESDLFPSSAGYGGLANMVTLANGLQDAPLPEGCEDGGVVTVTSGDNFLAGPEFQASLSNEEGPILDALGLSLMNYDALDLGNHDFDFGPDVTERFITSFTGDTPPPFLSANLDFSAEPGLQALVDAGRIAPSTVVDTGDSQVGIIGLTTPGLAAISSPRNVEVLQDIIEITQAEVDRLTGEGVDKIVLISHLQGLGGDDGDLEFVSQITGVDAVVAGGGDEVLADAGDPLLPGDLGDVFDSYPILVDDADGSAVPVVTTSGNYGYLGRLELLFDAEGNLLESRPFVDEISRMVRVADETRPDGVAADPTVVSDVYEPVQAFVDGLAEDVIATSEVRLNGDRPDIRIGETNAGNLVADSQRWFASTMGGDFGLDTDAIFVGVQNGGGIRHDGEEIGPGDITVLDTFSMVPFSNFVSAFEDFTIEELKTLLERAYFDIEGVNGAFLHLSNLEVEVDLDQQPQVQDEDGNITTEGERVRQLSLADGTPLVVDGEVVADAPTVTMTIVDFSARGGDGYPLDDDFQVLGATYQQVLADYIVAATDDGGLGGEITAEQYPEGGEGRITVTGGEG
ncbi:cell wall-binding repeat-containing protein [Euzebya rosea]|uniref:cell wall-binding repeat-containing protein n=1 Tax=Euzebya rosea TaxID=2052804 RepID=UPI001475DE06|nr:cell wall-binding repeat-containing protein [Euzebya rosea]